MKRLALLALAVLALALIEVDSTQAWPQRFTLKEISRENRASARKACFISQQLEDSRFMLRQACLTYSAKCRKLTHGRILCYAAAVYCLEDDYSLEDVEGCRFRTHEEEGYIYNESSVFAFDLWHPPNRHSHGLPRNRHAKAGDAGTLLLLGPRCALKRLPYLCNGPWVFKNKSSPWSVNGPGGCIVGCGPTRAPQFKARLLEFGPIPVLAADRAD